MKTKMFAAILVTLVVAVGCVKTVNDRKAQAWPMGKDKIEGRYQRSMSQVYDASVAVMRRLGTIGRETRINPGTNEVKAIEARVNDRRVWVRVEMVDPTVTAVTVQVRTKGGGTDILLTHELEKQIALELTK